MIIRGDEGYLSYWIDRQIVLSRLNAMDNSLAYIAGRWYGESGARSINRFCEMTGKNRNVIYKLAKRAAFWKGFCLGRKQLRSKEKEG
ncbi:MAG TPA: hypothetical protein PLA25_08060 [Anaerolineaceae bacterium]|nr:hypothetical protein [Anaerolineaceae bacterium]